MPLSKSTATYRVALYRRNINGDGTPKLSIMLPRDSQPTEGISVDCDGGRLEEDIVSSQLGQFNKVFSIFKLMINEINLLELFLCYSPTGGFYHCEIYLNTEKDVVDDISARKLLKKLKVVPVEK